MIDSRRDFLKKASLLAGSTALYQFIPASIQQALAIEADPGTTFLDAEHIVFLMQENRSFDHCFGAMRGVRGFNDPRVMRMEGLPIWYQKNKEGTYYAPFHLDIEKTKATWMGSLPHGWRDMVQARNEGRMDNWLEAKKAGKAYQHMPLTLGFYQRQDLPFYYAFADAFTVCDQHFCSSLTGTSPNRSHFWTGTVREEPRNPESMPHLDNPQLVHRDLKWKTFPERLQEAGVSWKVYQNEIGLPVGMTGEETDWLGNFRDNNLEFHEAYQVKFHPRYQAFIKKESIAIQQELEKQKADGKKPAAKLQKQLDAYLQDMERYSADKFKQLSVHQQEIHRRALTTNENDPDFHSLSNLQVEEGGKKAIVSVPKGDLFHQFRADVKNNELPTVSWLVAPNRFSDHPGSPWYGAWYVSETLAILTENPEVWKKTIFVLTYDENDGYYDHVPPFVPALHSRPETGANPRGMETADEYVSAAMERKRSGKADSTLASPIGLGFRVPLVVASPWSKGGYVNSEVFDLTSSIQFVEYFIEKKWAKQVMETNISPWRRLVCGNLTSIFRPAADNRQPDLTYVKRNQQVERIFQARDKALPTGYEAISPEKIASLRENQVGFQGFKLLEAGVKPACAIPYDMDVNFELKNNILHIKFEIDGKLPSSKTVGVPFFVKCPVAYGEQGELERIWTFAIKPQEQLTYKWPLTEFKADHFHLEVHGPNGFYRSFQGNKTAKLPALRLTSRDFKKGLYLEIDSPVAQGSIRNLYQQGDIRPIGKKKGWERWDLKQSQGWYDIEVSTEPKGSFLFKYAGHQENGQVSTSDPLMGNLRNG